MTSIATLRATNCSRLLYITERVVAACGTKTAYVFQYKGDQVDEASCTAPREADIFAPWLPPGAPITATRAVYSVRKDGGSAVVVQAIDNTAATSAGAPIEIVPALPDKIEEIRIFYQSILTLQTAGAVHFYFLDPSTAAATPMGTCALPAWSDSRDVRVEVTSSECWPGAAEKTICVLCLSSERMYAAVVVCASSSSAVVVRQTTEAGVALPQSPAKVLGWTLRWARQELVLLLQSNANNNNSSSGGGGAADKKLSSKELVSFSLQATGAGFSASSAGTGVSSSISSGGSANSAQLSQWAAPDRVAASLSGATGVALQAATDVCSDGDGTHVWLCDTVTGPAVVLREVATAAAPNEIVLTGTNVNARLTVARGVPGMFVLAGRGLFVVRGHGGNGSSTVNNGGATAAALAPASAEKKAAGEAEEAAEVTMSDWLEKQRVETPKASPAKKKSEVEAEAEAESGTALSIAVPPSASAPSLPPKHAVGQPKPQKLATTAVLTSSSSQIKEKLLQYVLGTTTAAVPYVIRDAVYVHEGGSQTIPRHDILDAIAERFRGDAAQHAMATLRYAAVAQSLHPYTVLALLNVRRAAPTSAPATASSGLLLALATLLSEKATLEHGGLQRLPNFAAVSAVFFHAPGCVFAHDLEAKQYTADLCAAAMAALANGGLGATRLLFAVADRAVSVLYGSRAEAVPSTSSTATSPASSAVDAQACEATIAEAVSLMRSYVEWSLTASASLGLMSAHVGTPQTLTKEAALRDGRAHPIDTSRQVEIRPLRVTRLPKKTL